MSKFSPSTRSEIDAFQAMQVLDKANAFEREGGAVYHLEVGQPGTGAPPSAKRAVEAALDDQVMGYTSAFGHLSLRQKLCDYYNDRYGATVSSEQVAITNGSSAGFVLSFLAAFEPGARVGLTAPGYPAYRNILKALGYEPVLLEVDASTRFQPTVEILAQHAPLDGLILASPSNPTGTMVTPSEYDAILDWCEASGCRLISDEIYHGLTWGREESTAAGRGSHAVIINSFSKYFSMTGWRVGWLILPSDLIEPVQKLSQNLFICAPAISQVAAEGALDDIEFLNQLCQGYRDKSAVLLEALKGVGLGDQLVTDGAFYAYLDISSISDDSAALAAQVLDETGVAIVPGHDFDPINGGRYVRLSFAGTMETVNGGATAFTDWIKKNR